MCELRHGMAHTLIDAPAEVSAFEMRNGNVHITGCDGSCQDFIAVTANEDDVGMEIRERRRKLRDADARRLRHGDGTASRQGHEDLRIAGESVFLHGSEYVAILREEGGCSDCNLQFQLRMSADCPEQRKAAGIVDLRCDDETNLPGF